MLLCLQIQVSDFVLFNEWSVRALVVQFEAIVCHKRQSLRVKVAFTTLVLPFEKGEQCVVQLLAN